LVCYTDLLSFAIPIVKVLKRRCVGEIKETFCQTCWLLNSRNALVRNQHNTRLIYVTIVVQCDLAIHVGIKTSCYLSSCYTRTTSEPNGKKISMKYLFNKIVVGVQTSRYALSTALNRFVKPVIIPFL
jgi:hypothetical protein